jgi:hypothetical protein
VHAPATMARQFQGAHIGKLLLKIADDPGPS